jgi:multiple sugar transport system ATP-binding protein
VASFIGNPAMNLMEGSMKGGVFSTEYTEIPGHSAAPDGAATLGFRAEDAEVVSSGGQINAPIYSLELLGDATMVTVRVKGALVSVRADKNYRAEIGDMVSISCPQTFATSSTEKAVSGSWPEARVGNSRGITPETGAGV